MSFLGGQTGPLNLPPPPGPGADMTCAVVHHPDLTDAPLFAGLDERTFAQLRPLLERRVYADGDIVFAEGQALDEVIVIVRGHISLWSTAEDEELDLVSIAETGDAIGELALVCPGVRRATGLAHGDVELVALSSQRFQALVQHRPELTARLLAGVARRAAERLNALAEAEVAVDPDPFRPEAAPEPEPEVSNVIAFRRR